MEVNRPVVSLSHRMDLTVDGYEAVPGAVSSKTANTMISVYVTLDPPLQLLSSTKTVEEV